MKGDICWYRNEFLITR